MALRELDLEKIANLYDVLERRFSELSAQFEASLADQAKKEAALFETSSAN